MWAVKRKAFSIFGLKKYINEQIITKTLILWSDSCRGQNRKFDVNKQKISWLKTHEILFTKSNPDVFVMKSELDDEDKFVDIKK